MKIHGYTPFNKGGDLGQAYNEIMERLSLDEWAIFLDHYIIVLDNSFWTRFYDAIESSDGTVGAFTCKTNAILNPQLLAKDAPATDSITDHTEYARSLTATSVTEVTSHLSGFCFATSKKAWLAAGRFLHGFGNVDICYGASLRRAGLSIKCLDGVYVYHRRISNGFKNLSKPTVHLKATSPKLIPPRPPDIKLPDFKIAVIIPALEEPPEELQATVRSFKENGADTVVVIDDRTCTPVAASCGADILYRPEQRLGPAIARHFGTTLVDADVYVWSDSHVRIKTPGFRTWAYMALTNHHLLCSAHTTSNSDTPIYGATLKWKPYHPDFGFGYVSNGHPTEEPTSLVGSVYAASKETYAKCKWPPNVGFGYNEPAFSLAAHTAGIKIKCYPWFFIQHEYRYATGLRAPYPVSAHEATHNRHWTHYLVFGKQLWEEYFSKESTVSQSVIDHRESVLNAHPTTADYTTLLSVAHKLGVGPRFLFTLDDDVIHTILHHPRAEIVKTHGTNITVVFSPVPDDPPAVEVEMTVTKKDGRVLPHKVTLDVSRAHYLRPLPVPTSDTEVVEAN